MIKKIVVVGGGFAGWYTAATLQYRLRDIEVTVISSDKRPTLGVGEVLGWNAYDNFKHLCGITDEKEFMYETGAIYKFGMIATDFFKDSHKACWGRFWNLKASSLCNFYNGFGHDQFDQRVNRNPEDLGVIDYWLSLYNDQKNYRDFELDVGEYAHFVNKPIAPFDQYNNFIIEKSSYGYHIDAERTSNYLECLVAKRNQDTVGKYKKVFHIVSTVDDVVIDRQGSIDHLILENGDNIQADLFIDASGLRRVLMKKSDNNSWQSSGNDYPDSAWVCPSQYRDPEKELIGATGLFGEDHGWRFQIRLFHRMGNGYVFNSRQTDPEIPLARLKEITDGTRIVEPRLIQWDPGEYLKPWQGNLIPLGISSGFIDPFAASAYDAHSRSLHTLINLLSESNSLENSIQKYNQHRNLAMEERRMRRDIAFGISQRSGPYWDIQRKIAQENSCLQSLQDIILGKRMDLDREFNYHWVHMYIRFALAAEVDMTDWDFPVVPQRHCDMVKAFFNYNRQRNHYFAENSWPNYYLWLQKNIFHQETNHDTFKRIQLEKYKHTRIKTA
jgi:tryptophan 7-halogenase